MTPGDYLLVFMGFLVFVILFLSLMIPIQLKFGSEKGRMVLFAIFFGIIGLVYLVNKVLTVDFTQTAFYQTITQLPMGILMAMALVLFVIFVFISAKISLGVMKKKEFQAENGSQKELDQWLWYGTMMIQCAILISGRM